MLQYSSQPLSSSRYHALDDLDSQLAKVVERDGALMYTPRGVTRKARRSRVTVDGIEERVHHIKDFLSGSEQKAPALVDEVQRMDYEVVGLTISSERITRERHVAVKHSDHPASAYVVSLRTIELSPHLEERVHNTHLTTSFTSAVVPHSMPLEVYATMSEDLSGNDMDPRIVTEQFTPQTFEEAYNRVYGRLDSFSLGIREAYSIVASWFHRVEHIEQEVVEDVGEALDLIEVPRLSFARAIAGFAAMSLIVTLPANALSFYHSAAEKKEVAMQLSAQALDQAKSAGMAGSVGASAEALKQASERFREADAALSAANVLAIGIASAVPEKYRVARALLEAGEKTIEAAGLLATGLDKIFSESGRQLDERLDVLGAYARSSLVLLRDASRAVATVSDTSVPMAQREHVQTLKQTLELGTQAISDFSVLSDVLSHIVGKEGMRTYLVIFQNQTELRPTGGFMGSFAEVTLDHGKIVKIHIPSGGTYDLKGDLKARITPPKPLQLINTLWQFQDANWDPDFPESAKKIRWFWSKSGQPTIDGVISINASMVQKLLEVTGAIDMPEYGKVITAQNFMLETQKSVELEYDKKENTPKKIIGDLSKRLLEKAEKFEKQEWIQVAGILAEAIETKDVQVAFAREDEEQIARRFGWSSRLKETVGDALAVVYSNIAGQKTDSVISEAVDHHVDIGVDGSIRDTVRISRAHEGVKGELFNGVRNVGYIRIFVPKGSVLVSANGFKKPENKWFKLADDTAISDPDVYAVESTMHTGVGDVDIAVQRDRTVFGGWVQLDPGQSQDIELKYDLPFTVKDILAKVEASPEASVSSRGAYLLLLTSQSGKSDRTIHTTVSLPKDWDISWSRTESSSTELGYSGLWDRDIVRAALLKPHAQTEAKK